ncbi:AAA family ATPase [Iocasia frigidifontis]|uniref:AAA family ATPase n=1 Tax=Iocasia fonsfrigidae TaxID=2682810 RepID=A0A8A7K8E2_9FIRM|nr:AAA family ATPase [Iocasia fonsfrigidae]QTL97470.1 AAA family ATPase [Iocasia fonsfrigidae]
MQNPLKQIPIGVDNFKEIIEREGYFVDKTLFIKDIIENISKVILLTRPRRFGKTLNFSMLKCFLEIPECRKLENEDKDYLYLFENLKISEDERFIKKNFGQYPVLNFSFKKIKANNWQDAEYLFKEEISREYHRHSYLLDDDIIESSGIRKKYERIMNMEGQIIEYTAAIADLTKYLNKYYFKKHYNKKVIVLIDEYDTPLHYAKLNGYYNEMLNVMRALMVDGMKSNNNLEKAIVTGIMKISQESIFSSFNNPEIATVNSKYCADQFGFTETEVLAMLKYYGLEQYQQTIQEWYNGYLFGNKTVIYNPWSILSFIKADDHLPKAYWINTGDTTLIKRCLQLDQVKGKEYIQKLYQGKTLEMEVEENIIYEDVFNNVDKAFSYLLHAGYLKARQSERGDEKFLLSIPNREVATIYKNILKNWFTVEQKTNFFISDMFKHLLSMDIEKFENDLGSLLLTVSSYYDTASVNRQIKMTAKREETERFENFYHGLMLGLMVNIVDDYYIESNKEYGLGRPDIVILPKDINKTGYIMEFKNVFVSSDKKVEDAAREALEQIEEKKYEEGLKKTGVKKFIKIGLGFKGKEVKVEIN